MANVVWMVVDEGWYSSTVGSVRRRPVRSKLKCTSACAAKRDPLRRWFAEPEGSESAGPFRTLVLAKAYVEEHGTAVQNLPEHVRLHAMPQPDFRPQYPFPLRRRAVASTAA
jgi:hypothetical protein